MREKFRQVRLQPILLAVFQGGILQVAIISLMCLFSAATSPNAER